VPSSDSPKKLNSGQAWVPDGWTADDIRCAGTYVANSNAPLQEGYHKTAEYNNVAVRILVDSGGGVTTICPDYDQTLYIEGVELR
jgi:hypothetical protein